MRENTNVTSCWHNPDWMRIGRRFTFGAITALCLWALATLLVLGALDALGLRGRDATDSATERSGVRLRTDHGTGCQYLETAGGGITPRVDRAGRHICR